MRLLISCLVLSAAACGVREHRGDGGSSPDANRPETDSGIGAPPQQGFAGTVELDDDYLTRLDPSSLPVGGAPCRQPILVRIRSATDGDTVTATGITEALDEHIRLIGVDTPEISRDGTPSDCYAAEAHDFTRNLEGHLGWLTFDATCRDTFDRLLAYVHVGLGEGGLWESQLLRRGLGRLLIIAPNGSLRGTLAADEQMARDAGTGLWSSCR